MNFLSVLYSKSIPSSSLLRAAVFSMTILFSSCGLFDDEVVKIEDGKSNTGLSLGNPSNAQASFLSPNNYLIDRPQYTLSFNNEKGIPNWVSWHLDRSWIGSASRNEAFITDIAIPVEWNRVTTSDYTGSGFDRGHNCPSADRTRSLTDNEATFLLTNIFPQAPKQNRGPWKSLEDFSRSLVFKGNELYVIMGSFGVGGIGSNGERDAIGRDGRITVPKFVWKVVVVLPEGDNDVQRIDASTRVIAVLMKNEEVDFRPWHEYRVSVNEIENATGYDLLSELPIFVQAILEDKVDDGPV